MTYKIACYYCNGNGCEMCNGTGLETSTPVTTDLAALRQQVKTLTAALEDIDKIAINPGEYHLEAERAYKRAFINAQRIAREALEAVKAEDGQGDK